ncbi:MAG TPA: hypothetical protein VMT46_09670 [Anaerolineaceae bacterium]|nr:hypothetical protein [Anaerolineaceae bacterium]
MDHLFSEPPPSPTRRKTDLAVALFGLLILILLALLIGPSLVKRIQPVLVPPTATPTPTAAPARPSGPGLARRCITVSNSLPAYLPAAGNLIYKRIWGYFSFHFPEQEKHQFPIVNESHQVLSLSGFNDYARSPDGKWLAYIESALDAQGIRTRQRNLRLVRSDGRIVDLSSVEGTWEYLIGWEDSEHIELLVADAPYFRAVSFNPFNGQVHDLPPLPKDFGRDFSTFSALAYNSQLTHLVYQPAGGDGSRTLVDLHATQAIGLSDQPVQKAVWSPDGTHLAFAALDRDTRDDTLTLIDRAGKTVKLSNPEGAYPVDAFSGFAWSPDGRSLATWMRYHENRGPVENWTLGLIDWKNQFVVDTCLGTAPSGTANRLVWSPDGRWLTFTYLSLEEGDTVPHSLLLDTQSHSAYPLEDYMVVLDWLATVGNSSKGQ